MYNREKEINYLLEAFKNCTEKGINCGLLVYGWRRVGKTTILKEFASRVGALYINCIWISDPYVFLKLVYTSIGEKKLEKEFKVLMLEEDPLLVLKGAFDLILNYSQQKKNLAVILDEFHIFVEKVSLRIAREKKQPKEIVLSDILGLFKEIVESKKAFWIFTSSIGWEKIKESIIKPKRAESPLIGVLTKYKIEPFDKQTTIGFVRSINPSIDMTIAEEIYFISGGIAKIAELIAADYKGGKSVYELALEMLRNGDFDDFFENIVKFIAEASKRDYVLLIQVLKAIGIGEKNTEDIAKHLNIDIDSAYVLAEELVKMEVVEKRKKGKRVFYRIRYPLLAEWVSLRVQPEESIYQILARKFGIAIESYVKELFEKYAEKRMKVEIWDDDKGTFLMGTLKRLEMMPKRIMRKEEAIRKYKIKGDFDLLIEEEGGLGIVEIKTSGASLKEDDLKQLKKIVDEIDGRGIIVVIEPRNIRIPVITLSTKLGIAIITSEALKLLAKKIGFVHW